MGKLIQRHRQNNTKYRHHQKQLNTTAQPSTLTPLTPTHFLPKQPLDHLSQPHAPCSMTSQPPLPTPARTGTTNLLSLETALTETYTRRLDELSKQIGAKSDSRALILQANDELWLKSGHAREHCPPWSAPHCAGGV